KPIDARIVLVATALINRPLASQFGLDRHDGHAIGLHPAITAALADIGIDEHPLVRVREIAALATAALFGGAGLNIDDGGNALFPDKALLHTVKIRALVLF